MASRLKHWNHSSLAKWIYKQAGVKRLGASSWDTFNEWHASTKQQHPIAYCIVEKIIPAVQNLVYLVPDIIDDTQTYIINRFIEKSHVLDTKLKAGKYYEIDTRMLHGMFETLVDYIEVEKAHMHLICLDPAARAQYTTGTYGRCKQAGLDYLKWEMTLADPRTDRYGNDASNPHQAMSAAEQFELYTWWTEKRSTRTLSDEDAYEEDTNMLVRLVKIRYSLWT